MTDEIDRSPIPLNDQIHEQAKDVRQLCFRNLAVNIGLLFELHVT